MRVLNRNNQKYLNKLLEYMKQKIQYMYKYKNKKEEIKCYFKIQSNILL